MSENSSQPKIWLIAIFVLTAGIIRVALSDIPDFANFAPVAAMALFGGAYLRNKKLAFILPVLVMLFSDVALQIAFEIGWRKYPGFHNSMIFVYSAFLLTVLMGTVLKQQKGVFPVIGASLSSSLVFFLITNFGVWITGGYPQTAEGLAECYTLAIPFLRNSVMGDLFFVGLLFGGYELIKRSYMKPAYMATVDK